MIKKFLIGTVAVLAFGVIFNFASAAYDFGATTLKVGSRGEAVKNLQMVVGATPVDGVFGPMTKAKVMAWQSNNGLTADGLFGNMSKAKANMGGAVSGNFPAGCFSAAGYSSTTGVKCDSVNANTFPAGCSSAAGYSSTTGAKCDGSTTGTVDNGPLAGGAGSATITELSSPSSNVKVGEGDDATKVYGVEVEADSGSDLSISSMKITLINGGTGSKRLERYAKSVSVWYNGVKVGSADASEFSEDSNTYSKSIAVSNVVVRAGVKGKIYFAVDAVENIDSADATSTYNTWTLTLTNTRYMDATGVVLTDTTASLANTIVFDTLASTNDVELKVGLSSSSRAATTVKLSATTDTNQVELLKFTMKAQGTKMFIDQIPVLFTGSEGTLSDITSNVTLVIDNQTFNESVAATAAATQTVLFNNLDLTVEEGATITGTIYADMNDIEDTSFDEGTTLNAALTSALVVATSSNYIDVEDINGDALAAGDRTGSAQGNTMTFRSTGVNVVMGTSTYANTVDTNGVITSVTYTIPVSVTSFGNTLYMGQTAQLGEDTTASNAFAYVFQNSSAPSVADTDATASATMSSVAVGSDSAAVIEGTSYRLDDGQTKHFVVEVTLTTPTTAANSYRVSLQEIQTFTATGWTGAAEATLVPVEQYQTAYKYIAS